MFFSVYSSPEAGLNSSQQQSSNVMNKFANRKSGRSRQFIKQSMIKIFLTSTLRELFLMFSCVNFFFIFHFRHTPDSKGNMLNGQMGQRVRERIPTPENDNRVNGHHHNHNNNPFSNIQSIASGVALTAQNLATNPSIFPSSNNVPILGTLLLSPIKESDSVNNTLSSGSLAPSKSILPLNYKSTNTHFGSLVIPTSSTQDLNANTNNSFVVIQSSSHENEIIPVSITTVPLTISTSNQSTSSGAIITELPLDQPDSFGFRSPAVTPSLGNLFNDSPASKQKIQRQQSVESNRSEPPAEDASNVSESSTSTTSKRPGAGNKHSEVYV